MYNLPWQRRHCSTPPLTLPAVSPSHRRSKPFPANQPRTSTEELEGLAGTEGAESAMGSDEEEMGSDEAKETGSDEAKETGTGQGCQ